MFKIHSYKKKIVFENEGNEIYGYINPGDIELNLIPKKHDIFSVDGYNIIYKQEVTLKKFYEGCRVKFIHLDGQQISLHCTGPLFKEMIFNDKVHYKTLRGRGLPIPDKGRGDLLIQFVIRLQ